MKKLILSMLIALGAIVSTQAQAFDFTCINDVVDNSNDNTFDTIEEGFSADQIAIFIFNGFDQVTIQSGNGFRRPEVDSYGNSFTFSVQFGEYRKIAAADDPQESGLYPYRTLGAQGRQSFYDTAAEVMADLMLIDPNADSDEDGFTNGEERDLITPIDNDGLVFSELSPGIYQIVSSNGNFYIEISPNDDGSFLISDDLTGDVYENRDTLEEAMAFALIARTYDLSDG